MAVAVNTLDARCFGARVSSFNFHGWVGLLSVTAGIWAAVKQTGPAISRIDKQASLGQSRPIPNNLTRDQILFHLDETEHAHTPLPA